MYVRGNKRDYDEWEAMGNLGWAYEKVLPYFKKSEKAVFKNRDEEFHGNSGYWHIDVTSDMPNDFVSLKYKN